MPFTGWLQLSGGYAQVPYQDEIKLDPSNGSFTIEGWIKDPYFNDEMIPAISKKDSFKLIFRRHMRPNPPYDFIKDVTFWKCSGFYCSSSSSHELSVTQGWFHFAYIYNQVTNTGAFFWNGQMFLNEPIPYSSTEPIIIQYANSMDEFRISNNVRYTSPFTPASAPFECDENTLALWHFDEIEDSTIFHDACGAVDNMFIGYNGTHTEGVTGYRVNLPLVIR